MSHIEFIGLPGSGKSTIYNEIENKLNNNSKNILSCKNALTKAMEKQRNDKLYKIIFKLLPRSIYKNSIDSFFLNTKCSFIYTNEFLSEYGDSLLSIFNSEILKLMDKNEKTNLLSHFFLLNSKYSMIKKYFHDKEIIYDEGFIQRSKGFFLSTINNIEKNDIELAKKYFKSIPLPNKLFYIECSIDICIDRIENRDKGLPYRIKNYDNYKIIKYFENIKIYFNTIIKFLEQNGVKVISINNNTNIEKSIKEILLNLEL